MYLVGAMRPGVSFVVSKLSRFTSNLEGVSLVCARACNELLGGYYGLSNSLL
jgi:hypothetical protein